MSSVSAAWVWSGRLGRTSTAGSAPLPLFSLAVGSWLSAVDVSTGACASSLTVESCELTPSSAAAASSASFIALVLRGLRAGFSAGGGSVTATFDPSSKSFSDMWFTSLQSRRDLAPQGFDT